MTITNHDARATSPISGEVPPGRAPAARTRRATKRYGQGDATILALDAVDMDLEAGRFTAIMGPSGSGKSTLMHCLAGLDAVSSGEVWLGDVELGGLSDRALTRLRRDRIGFVFQAFNLVPTLSAYENVVLPMQLARRAPDADWLSEVIQTVGLGDRLSHRPSELSGGQQQRVAVARALAGRPAVVVADEPTGNLDSTSGGLILSFLRRAVDEMGQTVAMVTHDAVAASYADSVLFLADGRIVDDLRHPTADSVLDHMKQLGG